MTLGPDEHMYDKHKTAWKVFGRLGLRVHARQYLSTPRLRDYPSPVRWLWSYALYLARPYERFASAFFAIGAAWITLAISPLLMHLARRRLQDCAVAFATVSAIVAAHADRPIALAYAFAWLLALKPEAGLLAVPAIVLASPRVGWDAPVSELVPLGAALGAGTLVYACATVWVFGPRLAGRLWAALAQKHDTEYGREHQRGMWHRVFVDLALVSPVWVGLALWYHPAALVPCLALVVAHACTPVRNIRTVLAVDLLMRAELYAVAPWWACALAYASDAWLVWRARRGAWYDTPTAELVRAACKGAP